MARLRGSPKNKNQGIYWVQRANSGRGRRETRQVNEYTVEYDEEFELFSYDDNGILPKKYTNDWVKESTTRAKNFALEIILIINQNNRFDFSLSQSAKLSINDILGKPKKPNPLEVPDILTTKNNFYQKIPFIGNWFVEKEKVLIENNAKEIDDINNRNEILNQKYNKMDREWLQNNGIKKISDLNVALSLELIETYLSITLHKSVFQDVVFGDNYIYLPFINFQIEEKKPIGPNKAVNRILFKKKLKKEAVAEQVRSNFIVYCSLYKMVKALGYSDDLRFNSMDARNKSISYIINDETCEYLISKIGAETFDYDLDFIDKTITYS